MYQKVIVAGYLGRDPEIRYTPDGTPVTDFSIATSNKWTGSDGTPHEETTWIKVTVWRRMAEVCAQYLRKGRPVLVEGRLSGDKVNTNSGGVNIVPHTWTNEQTGEVRAQFEITAETVKFLGGRNDSGAGDSYEEPTGPTGEDEEIPF